MKNRSIKMLFLFLTVASICLVLVGKIGSHYYISWEKARAVMEPKEMKKPVIPFSASLKNSNIITHKSFEGKLLLLNFWATWCAPCREELPSMIQLYKEFKGKGLELLAISVDKNWSKIDSFFFHGPPPFPIGLDATKRSAEAYKVGKFPESFLITPTGQIVAHFVGPRNWYSPYAIKYFREIIRNYNK